ncbi:nuclease [Schizosaccharomyces japonicus yFS275]|uniref:Probable endonuclease lcl3 n=1 Tax=Schizosaccharomyces japonicus (strain yFS275 / FY16936) TaxID=402676 RepID=LCL3_SCHJY|nr:nuclease [Schizosaccharomyces japonicus yFS275]B6JYT1.1 RecName: Full=Probable endonuclease lcl3 [Schizosaccharomyces japonicus yFS275]EEB06699.1 nuclease [Schizosaccharomyces japonicus yFS275]
MQNQRNEYSISLRNLSYIILTISTGIVIHRKFRRIKDIEDLSSRFFRGQQKSLTKLNSLYGYVTSVGDGDNFRFYHTPGGRLLGWHWLRKVPSNRNALKNETLSIRLSGIDAPESGYFGKLGQPFSLEAKQFLARKLEHRSVRVYPLHRDQYNRAVCGVTYYPIRWLFFKRDIGPQLVSRGLAVVYEGANSSYYPTEKSVLMKIQETARKRKLGMHSLGNKLELPKDYKKRNK